MMGVYRPPEQKRTAYEGALTSILAEQRNKQITMIVAGEQNLITWQTGYAKWLSGADLRESTNPAAPTFKTGTVGGAMVTAITTYLPEGTLLGKGALPVYITEEPVTCGHMALPLDVETGRSGIKSEPDQCISAARERRIG